MTRDELLVEFQRVFEQLPQNVQEILHDYWEHELPVIITNPIDIILNPFGVVKKAGNVGKIFYFHLDRLQSQDITPAIREEIAHSYTFATKEFTIEKVLMNYNTHLQNEARAKQLVRQWFHQ